MCESWVGMRMVEKWWWGFLKGRKGKEKWKEDMKRKNWIENEMKINGDGYGKNKWVRIEMGTGVELT